MKENTPQAMMSLGFLIIQDADGNTVYLNPEEWPAIRNTADGLVTPRGMLLDEVNQLWAAAPKEGRARSSKKQLTDKWKQHRKSAPKFELVLKSLNQWCQSKSWRDGYAEGIHRWVQNHRWEVEPLDAGVSSGGFRASDVGI